MPTKLKSTGVEFPDGSTQTSAVSGAPAGALQYFAMNTEPDGWLKANGAEVSRSTYADLFDAIGETFGAGDGSTTFELPDLRGEFVRGMDNGRGVDSGRGFGSAQGDAFQGHWHEHYANDNNVDVAPGSDSALNTRTIAPWEQIVSDTNGKTGIREAITDNSNGTPRTASETRPRNIALLACIKY